MKAKRLLFLVMAICLASGVKAQFYDGPDDICYYVECDENGKMKDSDSYAKVTICNFDGQKACSWSNTVYEVKKNLRSNPNYYEDKVETTEYLFRYLSNNTYTYIPCETKDNYMNFVFSNDRSTATFVNHQLDVYGPNRDKTKIFEIKVTYKRVNKNFFNYKVGRSRTPSGSLYE